MTDWQLAAAFIAAVLTLLAIAGYLRYPRPVTVILLGLLIGVPTVGFVSYVVLPQEVSSPGWLTWLAFVPVVVGVGAGTAVNLWMLASRDTPLNPRRLRIVSAAFVVMWLGIVLGISDVLAMWEPGFAIANLVVNTAWLCAWIPPRTRRLRVVTSVDVTAAPSRVFAFMTDTANWPKYLEDVEQVDSYPDGRLRVGTIVAVRRHVPVPGLRGPRLMPSSVETRSVVTSLEPDRRLASASLERPSDGGTTELTPLDGGTRITSRAQATVPLTSALLGTALFSRALRRDRQAANDRDAARLKQLLEQRLDKP